MAEIAIVFTGDKFADGGEVIRETLKGNDIKASFFLTGNFYANASFSKLIKGLKRDHHYLGPHSDKHLLYADWTKRDSLLIDNRTFELDLLSNYEKMKRFGIYKNDARYFLPPFEWYNRSIVKWTEAMGLTLVNFSTGTRSAADYTFPEMDDRYLSSEKIYQSIFKYESGSKNGMNGFILLIHIGTDPRRTDKFYRYLDQIIKDLKSKGYKFKRIDELLE
jgi:peptidoglycan/xylan/chitin deacetylase (PgdA/CDA1 family)